MSASPVIEVAGLRKSYGSLVAVDDVAFTVEPGRVFGLLGPNGAGKTTTIEILEGLRQADGGEVRLFGLPLSRLPEIKERIGVQFQATALPKNLTALEVLDLFASFYRRSLDPRALLETLQLEDKAATLSQKLSGGQQQRLALAVGLINNPELAFLDEPTSGLDPQARRHFWSLVRQWRDQGKTLFLTTHYMEEAEALCDEVAIIDHGRILALGSPAALAREHFRETAIRVTAETGVPIDRAAGLEGVVRALPEPEGVLLYSTDVPRTLAGLLAPSNGGRPPFKSIEIRPASLEDVFLELTGRSLRD